MAPDSRAPSPPSPQPTASTASASASVGNARPLPRVGDPALKSRFLLDPAVTYLNHGSFGAIPDSVFEAQERWRRRIEQRPIELLGRRVRELMLPAKQALGRIVGCAPEEIGFVTNATEAINAVLNSLRFERGDELLTTTHVYNAIRQAMRFTAERFGATVREAEIPWPCPSPAAVVDAFVGAISPATRLVVIDHVTSPTALVLPIEPILEQCRRRGIMVIVDGAHAPGMIEIDLERLDADAYAANLHKWLFAPKGCGMLRMSSGWRTRVHPCVISHFYGQGFAEEFDWQGTRDVSPWLALADAIEFVESLGLRRIREHNHALAAWAHAHLVERLGVPPMSPLDGSMLGSTATVRLPDSLREQFGRFDSLAAHLYDRERIEVPVIDFGGAWHVRISAQVYVTRDDIERLAEALRRAIDRRS